MAGTEGRGPPSDRGPSAVFAAGAGLGGAGRGACGGTSPRRSGEGRGPRSSGALSESLGPFRSVSQVRGRSGGLAGGAWGGLADGDRDGLAPCSR